MSITELRPLDGWPQREQMYRDAGIWTDDTLASCVVEHAAQAPDAVAVVDLLGERSKTYAELAHDAAVVASGLAERGVRPGDVVSIQLPNRYEAVVSAVAAQSLGAVINPLLPNYRLRELSYVFATAQPKVVISPDEYRGFDHIELIREVGAATGVTPLHVIDGKRGSTTLSDLLAVGGSPTLEPHPAGVSELIFTSGTEANPKAILHTEQDANSGVRILFADLGIGQGDVIWMPSPVGHSTGFNFGLRAAMLSGLPLVLQDRWDAAAAVELVQQFGCTYSLAATTFLSDLVARCEETGTRLPTLTRFGCGGATVPPALVERAERAGITVLRLYGSTEVLCAAWNRPEDDPELRRTTDGRPLSHTEIEIRDDSGRPVPVGEPGELYVRGPQTSVGFFRDPDRTSATYLPGDWIRTGDLATLEEHGHITIVGRKKEILIRGGVNIAPREIEEMLVSFPEVERAAVVGVPDDRLGERMCAVLTLRSGATLTFSTMVDHLRELGLATYKLPERLEILEELPATASGKIQKHEIVRILADAEQERTS